MDKNKKATINPKNNDDNCFRYALTIPLNYKIILKILKEYKELIHLFINTIGKR